MHLVLGSLSIVKRRLQTLPSTVLYIRGESLLSIGCSMWLLSTLLPPSSIATSIQYLPISRCIQQISTYIGGLLASIAVAVLYWRGTGSPLGVIVTSIFPVLSLPLIDIVLLGLYIQAYYLFGEALLLIYILTFGVYPSLLSVLVLWLLFILPLCLYRRQVVVLLLRVPLWHMVFAYRLL